MCLRKKKLLKGGVVEINMDTTRELEGREKKFLIKIVLTGICVQFMSLYLFFQAAERKVKNECRILFRPLDVCGYRFQI